LLDSLLQEIVFYHYLDFSGIICSVSAR